MNEFYKYEFTDEEIEETKSPEKSRDYNYRKHHKIKEQKRRELIASLNYWPTMPVGKVSDNGDVYYVEGTKANDKAKHKKLASRAARRNDEFADNGSTYKKHYDFWWNWF